MIAAKTTARGNAKYNLVRRTGSRIIRSIVRRPSAPGGSRAAPSEGLSITWTNRKIIGSEG